MNTTSSTTITLTDSSGNAITVDDTGTLTVDSTGYITTTNGTLYNNNIVSHSHSISGYSYQPTYSFVEEGEKLVIRDQQGRECLAIKDGKLMIGERTLHQVILDVIDMVNGDKAITDLLVDPDQAKRELGKEIYERRSRKTKSKRAKTQSDKE